MTGRVPLVSVIVPTLNRPTELAEALASVAGQRGIDPAEVQVVVVNDGGADITAVVRASRAAGMRITAVAHRHRRGLPSARNTGLDLARGRFVAFLDDDDMLLPEHLSTALTYLDPAPDAPSCGFGGGGRVDATVAACLVTEQRSHLGRAPYGAERWDVAFDPELLQVCNLLPVHAAVLRRPPATARFDAALGALEDWDFWLRLTRDHGYRFARLPQATAVYHRVPSSSSMLNTVVAQARPMAELSRLVRRVWRRWPAGNVRTAAFRTYAGVMYWQLLEALATDTALNPHYYLHSIRAIAEAWADPAAEPALLERLADTVTGGLADALPAA